MKNVNPMQPFIRVLAPYNPTGYCWSRSYKVCVVHIISICMTKKEGQKVNATREETKGGKEYNKT